MSVWSDPRVSPSKLALFFYDDDTDPDSEEQQLRYHDRVAEVTL